jgi:hypothetical protein
LEKPHAQAPSHVAWRLRAQSNSDQLSLKANVFKITFCFSVQNRIIFGAPGRAAAARPDLPKKIRFRPLATKLKIPEHHPPSHTPPRTLYGFSHSFVK